MKNLGLNIGFACNRATGQLLNKAKCLLSPSRVSRFLAVQPSTVCVSSGMNLYENGRAGIDLFTILVGFVLLVFTGECFAGRVEIQGEVSDLAYFDDNTIETNFICPFILGIDSNKWNILVKHKNGYFTSAGGDGTNVYSLLLSSNDIPGSTRNGFISAGLYPLHCDAWVTIPWLAFCSSSFFLQQTNMPAPWLNAQVFPLSSCFYYEVKTSLKESSEIQTPQNIRFFVKKKLLPEILNMGWLRPDYSSSNLKMMDYYTNYFFAGEYSVVSFTNISGMNIPTSFKLKRFLPEKLGGSDRTYVVYSGCVNTIKLVNENVLMPNLDLQTRVTDYRFKDLKAQVNYINYLISTGGNWPCQIADRLDLQKNLALKIQANKKMLAGRSDLYSHDGLQKKHIWLFRALLLALLFIPVLVLIGFQKNKQHKLLLP